MNSPIDFLESRKQKEVSIVLKNRRELKGKLVAYDLNINLYIEVKGRTQFVHGHTVNYIF